jgi:hypothetical protein
VRLDDGTHVAAHSGELPNAYLPSKATSGFPTVCTTVCQSEESLKFLKSTLRLTEPDPVDDVIVNIMPLYEEGMVHEDLELYRHHLQAIESAHENRNTREKLIAVLRTKNWVASINNGGTKDWLRPNQCYMPTERLVQLFDGVPNIDFVDNSVGGLQGETIRNILITCGTSRYLDTVTQTETLSSEECFSLRQRFGDTGCSNNEKVDDHTLHGLDGILRRISELPSEEASARCHLLWEALGDVIQDKRQAVVKGRYSWFYYSQRSITFDAAFIRTLKKSAWVPAPDGRITTPDEVVFERIAPGWLPNPVLQSALTFRSSELEEFAKAAGFDIGILSILKKSGITNEAELKQRLGLTDEDETADDHELDDSASLNDELHDDNGVKGVDHNEKTVGSAGGKKKQEEGGGIGDVSGRFSRGGSRSGGIAASTGMGQSSSSTIKKAHAGRTEFFSYLKTQPVEVDDDEFADAETHDERMRVEKVAIEHIRKLEPDLQPTPRGNKGFDLLGTGKDGHQNRWIEVKAMVGTLANHPVGMSQAQFKTAQEKEHRYWLYIVEQALSDEPRILKIQDPAGNARTFTFDAGWSEIAIVSQVNVETGEVLDP